MAKGDGETFAKAKADARHRKGCRDGSGFGETLGVGEGLQGSQCHPGECQDLARGASGRGVRRTARTAASSASGLSSRTQGWTRS